MSTVISVENLSKSYRLGQIGTGTFRNDLKVWWAKLHGRPNPLLKIGQSDHEDRDGEEIWALRDVSFTVEQGEVLGIIGRNGAGKSTLLKILSRVTAPTSGQVKVKGRIASLLEVGTGFHRELTGRENIYLNGAILGMSKDEVRRKFDEIVAFADVEKFIDTPVKRYSSGMYVRLAFAVAAHLDPEILLVDEVLAVGDVEFQKKCLGKMGTVAKEGRTILFVSHNMGAIRSLCPKSLLLSEGKIVELEETTNVIKDYLNISNNLTNLSMCPRKMCSELEHSGSGGARIIWAEIKNSRNISAIDFEMDEPILIKFGVNNPSELNLNYAVEILDKNDYPLFHLLSEYEDVSVITNDESKENIIVQIRIPPLYLFPDEYYINLWVGMHHHRIDKVSRCFLIRVLKSPSINRDLLTTRGRIYSQGTWQIKYEVFNLFDNSDHGFTKGQS